MFALLTELAASDAADAPRLLLGIEEPELFQHPPQAQHLADVLAKLSTQNAQVFACSHSPYFVNGKGFEDVRLFKPAPEGEMRGIGLTFAKLAAYLVEKLGEDKYKKPEGARAKISQALQPVLREMFFAPKVLLVEGLEDMAFLIAGFNLLGKWEEWRATGCHIVPVNGKSELVQPLAMAQLLKIPVFVMFDSDGNVSKAEHVNMHKADNERLLKLLGGNVSEPFPKAIVSNDQQISRPENFGNQIEADFPRRTGRCGRARRSQNWGSPAASIKTACSLPR